MIVEKASSLGQVFVCGWGCSKYVALFQRPLFPSHPQCPQWANQICPYTSDSSPNTIFAQLCGSRAVHFFTRLIPEDNTPGHVFWVLQGLRVLAAKPFAWLKVVTLPLAFERKKWDAVSAEKTEEAADKKGRRWREETANVLWRISWGIEAFNWFCWLDGKWLMIQTASVAKCYFKFWKEILRSKKNTTGDDF